MTKPSELKEDEWIKLVNQGGDYQSCIVFHVHYGELWAVAGHPDAEPTDTYCGLGITNNTEQADAIYDRFKDSPFITEQRGGWRPVDNPKCPHSMSQERWSETVRTGVKLPEDD